MNNQFKKNLNPILLQWFKDPNMLNIALSLIFFPIMLFWMKRGAIYYPLFTINLCIFVIYFYFYFKKKWLNYMLPLSFIVASSLLIIVIAGNTVPVSGISIFLGITLFLMLDVLFYNQYKRAELARQILVAGSLITIFLFFTFLFGILFLYNFSLLIVMLLCFSMVFLNSFVLFKIYEMLHAPLYAFVISVITTELFFAVEQLPFGHLTSSIMLVVFLFFSINLFIESHMQNLTKREIILHVVSFIIMYGLIFLTARA